LKINLNIPATLEVPDDVIYRYNVSGKIYALELNDILYIPQICFVAEGGAWGNEIITDHQEMENHSITNVRYDAEFIED
jgi:hypothetical protein